MSVKDLLIGSHGPSLQRMPKPDKLIVAIKEFRVNRAKVRCVKRNLKIEKYTRLVDDMVDSAAYDPRVWDYHKEIRRLTNLVHRDKLFIRRTENDLSTRHDS